jgi:hypothetical protein
LVTKKDIKMKIRYYKIGFLEKVKGFLEKVKRFFGISPTINIELKPDQMITLSKDESFELLERCKFNKQGLPIIIGLSSIEAYHALHLFECTFPEYYWGNEPTIYTKGFVFKTDSVMEDEKRILDIIKRNQVK